MSKQITINKSFYDKMSSLETKAKEAVYSKGEQIVSYAVAISPVQTGAYVESFSVVERGASGGRSRTSNNKPVLADKQSKKEEEAARLRSEVRATDPLESGGFTLRNRSPHANVVEDNHKVFARTKDRFR